MQPQTCNSEFPRNQMEVSKDAIITSPPHVPKIFSPEVEGNPGLVNLPQMNPDLGGVGKISCIFDGGFCLGARHSTLLTVDQCWKQIFELFCAGCWHERVAKGNILFSVYPIRSTGLKWSR